MTIHTPMTEQQVLIHLMLAMAAADEAISDAELSRVERLIDFLPVFENFPPEDLDIVTDSFVELMAVEEGLDSLMTLLASTLPDELHETAYPGRTGALGATLRKKNERKRARIAILRWGSASGGSTLKCGAGQLNTKPDFATRPWWAT